MADIRSAAPNESNKLKLPPRYEAAVKKLIHDLSYYHQIQQQKNISQTEQIKNVLFTFSKSFTLPPNFNYIWINHHCHSSKSATAIVKLAINHLYNQKFCDLVEEHNVPVIYEESREHGFSRRNYRGMNIRHCTDDYMTILKIPAFDSIIKDMQIKELEKFVKAEEAAEKALSFPSAHLDKLLEALKEYSTSPISSTILQRFRKAKEIFQELPTSIEDEDKWIKLIKQSDNTEFIYHSFKLRIGNDFTNLKLWQSYIEVAKDRSNNEEDYLSIYYQYCHLFVDDEDMRKKWAQELTALCQNGKDMTDWWIKLVKTENCFGTSENIDTFIEKAVEINKNTKKLLKCAVENTQNYEKSRALEAKHNELYPPVSRENMLLDAVISFSDFRLPDDFFNRQFSKPQNMTLKEKDIFSSFHLPKEKSVVTDFPKDVFSHILKNASPKLWMKLYQTCKFFFAYKKQLPKNTKDNLISKIQTPGIQYIAFDYSIDLKIENLLKFGQTLKKAEFTKLFTGQKYIVQDFIPMFPVIEELSLPFYNNIMVYTSETSKFLASYERSVKFSKFEMVNIVNVEVHDLIEFTKKNAAPNSVFKLGFSGNKIIYEEGIKQMLETWVPENEKPTFSFA
uniref:Uncharacterized protein n=1 Tax=Panagrolaimus davidi TaxID=227884 RepID=A0A914P9B0_9BILA